MNSSPQDCEKAIASLLACTRRRSRPLDLVTISGHLKVAIQCLGELDNVASVIGLSSSMLKRFEYVERLHPDLKSLVASRQIDSIDSVAELGSLPTETQERLAALLPWNSFDTEDIRGCVRLINSNPEIPIDQVIRKVTESKTVQIFIYEFVVSESICNENIVRRNVLNILSPEDIAAIELRAATGRLKVYKTGRLKLSEGSKSRRMSVHNFIQMLCKGDI